MAKIAQALFLQGNPDEALRILTEDVLPVFEQLRLPQETEAAQSWIEGIREAKGMT